MFLSRFNHAAARDAALAHARALHAQRLHLSLAGLFEEHGERREIERRIAELELREHALLQFADDPFAADSLQRIFDAEDRAQVVDAGRPSGTGGLAPCAA